jgi:hypothetical protein
MGTDALGQNFHSNTNLGDATCPSTRRVQPSPGTISHAVTGSGTGANEVIVYRSWPVNGELVTETIRRIATSVRAGKAR